jgi:methionyl-tRNA formyltransferase
MEIVLSGHAFQRVPGGERARLVLLTSDDPQHSYLRRLLASELNLVATIVEPSSAQQQRLWHRRHYRDALYRAYQARRQQVTGRARYRRTYFGQLEHALPAPASPLYFVRSVNDEATVQVVEGLAPDLAVVCGTAVLGRRLIDRLPALTVNIHCGRLPRYRGNHCIYFAYLNRDWDQVAATLHLVTTDLDSGAVIATVVPEMFPHDSDEHLYSRCSHQGALLLVRMVRALERGETIVAVPQADDGMMFRHRDRGPIREIGLWWRRRTGRHQPPVRMQDERFDRLTSSKSSPAEPRTAPQ